MKIVRRISSIPRMAIAVLWARGEGPGMNTIVKKTVSVLLALCSSGLIALVLARPAVAQPSPREILHAIVVRITVRNATTTGICHGYVGTVRYDVAYVVTAKHCVEILSPLTEQPGPALTVTITYPNGGTGWPRFFYWDRVSDIMVMAATFSHYPASYTEMCPACRIYTSFAPNQTIPILSILSSSGGEPVLSNGLLLTNGAGEITVVLPSAPGTSGAPVVDLRGMLVGIVSAIHVFGGSEAGALTILAPGSRVKEAVDYAVTQFEARASVPPSSRPAPVSQPSPPRLPPSGDLSGTVFRVSSDLTTFVVMLANNGRQVYLGTDMPCDGINQGDTVTLRVNGPIGNIIMFTPGKTCYLRVTETR
jgi:hypothetical protein